MSCKVLCTVSGVHYYLNSNHRKYITQTLHPFSTLSKISIANLQILWRHLSTELWNVCVVKYIYSFNRRRKLCPNRSIIDDIPTTSDNTWKVALISNNIMKNYSNKTKIYRAWFSRLLRHPAMRRRGSILTTTEPAQGCHTSSHICKVNLRTACMAVSNASCSVLKPLT